MRKNKDAVIKTTYVFSENNQVLVKQNLNAYTPINFYWMPMTTLYKQMYS